MKQKNYIPIPLLCSNYEVELSFFTELNDKGLIEITTIEQMPYLHQDEIYDIEKMIRLHHELNVNIEGIDVVFNLLAKVDGLQNELNILRNKLKIYEGD